MIGIEKYTLKDGQTGWLVNLSAKTQNQKSGTTQTKRFSCARYGEQAFQKALEWFENSFYQAAEIKIKSPTASTAGCRRFNRFTPRFHREHC